jgi:conjugative relaxase-like TrwC/TraI family protein
MGGGKADYYTSLAASDYYVGESLSLEPSGYWIGKGAEKARLDGERVNAEDFKNLFHGFSTDGKEKWVYNAGRYKGTERDRMPGFDLTVSAPKSVSICWALGSNEVREGIEKAQREAVAIMVEKIEEKTIIRSGSGGKIKESAGIIAGVFQHGTARQVDKDTPPDMQLHSHICVINTGLSARGTKGALNGQDFLNPTFAKEYGAIYRAELARGLREMGFELEATKDAFEIKGIKREAVEDFSKRGGQIEKSLEKGREESSAKEKLAANHKTRQAKREYDPKDLVNLWATTAEKKHHLTYETIDRLRGKEETQGQQKTQATPEDRLKSVRDAALELAEEKGAFTKREFHERALHKATVMGIGSDGMKDAANEYLKREAVYLASQKLEFEKKGETQTYQEGVYTTAHHKFAVLKKEHERAEKTTAVEERRTSAFKEAARHYESQGSKVMCATWSKAKAEEMERATGIKSTTVRSLVADGERDKHQVLKDHERNKNERKREIFAQWKYATWQMSKTTRDKYLGKDYVPSSKLVHEIKYATHQISKTTRDNLNRRLEIEKARAERTIENGMVIIVSAPEKSAERSRELQDLMERAQRKGARVVFSDTIFEAARAEDAQQQRQRERQQEQEKQAARQEAQAEHQKQTQKL